MNFQNYIDSPTISEASTLINIEDSSEEILNNNDVYKKFDVQISDKTSIKDALKCIMPSKETLKLGLLILGWYCSSAFHSNYSKKVLKQYKHPVTMTYIQFLSIVIYSMFSHMLRFTELKHISKYVIKQTLPLSIFQIGGHLLNSYSLSLVSVNFVQTIKVYMIIYIN